MGRTSGDRWELAPVAATLNSDKMVLVTMPG